MCKKSTKERKEGNILTPINVEGKGSSGHLDSSTSGISAYCSGSPFDTTLMFKLGVRTSTPMSRREKQGKNDAT